MNYRGWTLLVPISYPDWSIFGIVGLRQEKTYFLLLVDPATSWIVNKLINNHGGLHNRLTNKILLHPFSLSECEQYSEANNLGLSRYQIVENYMIMGEFLLLEFNEEKSLVWLRILMLCSSQMKSKVCHMSTNNYMPLCLAIQNHIWTLYRHWQKKTKGLSRDEISKLAKVRTGGELSKLLNELEWCGFIRKYNSIGKQSKDSLYQLIDNFTFFYFQYIKGNKNNDSHFGQIISAVHYIEHGVDLLFERVCLQHISQIKEALGISGVLSNVYSWRTEADEDKGIDKNANRSSY